MIYSFNFRQTDESGPGWNASAGLGAVINTDSGWHTTANWAVERGSKAIHGYKQLKILKYH